MVVVEGRAGQEAMLAVAVTEVVVVAAMVAAQEATILPASQAPAEILRAPDRPTVAVVEAVVRQAGK